MLNSRKLGYLVLFIIGYTATVANADDKMIATLAESPTQQLDLTLPSTDSKKQKSRMRKTQSDNKKKSYVTYREMSYEELREGKDQHMAQRNYTSAIKYLEQMIKLCDDVTAIGQHLLQIADLLLIDDQYARAAQKYAEYVALYPGGESVEYALFKAIESSFACTLSNDRDQTKTEETLALAESFLRQDHLNTYVDEVTAIRDQCYNKLAESELNICSFYLKRGDLKPAEKRLVAIRSMWLPKLPDLEMIITMFEADLSAQKDALEQKVIKATTLAQNDAKKQKHMAERF